MNQQNLSSLIVCIASFFAPISVEAQSPFTFVDKAKELLTKARTVQELRQAQAVILPLEFSMSLDQTSSIIGVSKGWVCQLRTDFIRNNGNIEQKASRGGRYRENLSLKEEAEFLSPFIEEKG